MGHQDREMDLESLQRTERRRGSCLDAFLVTSIIFLFVAVVALAVGGAIFVMKQESPKVQQGPNSSVYLDPEMLTGHSPDPTYKMNHFVFLEATSFDLKNYTMVWSSVSYGTGDSVGSNFVFDKEQSSLSPKQEGSYFIYMDLKLTCTHKCPAGILSLQVGKQLTCEVQLPAVSDSTPVSKKCWTVSHIKGEKLITQMIVPESGLKNWKLESGSGMGMFLVD